MPNNVTAHGTVTITYRVNTDGTVESRGTPEYSQDFIASVPRGRGTTEIPRGTITQHITQALNTFQPTFRPQQVTIITLEIPVNIAPPAAEDQAAQRPIAVEGTH